ncbi:MAG: beta-L-arabinofuranosidase domain-containing protein [Chitinophagaceae bacterium]
MTKHMARRLLFLPAFSLLCFVSPVISQQQVTPAVKDVLQAGIAARLGGFIGERLDGAYHNRILAQDADNLVKPFLNRTEVSCWQSEFWGKWFTSALLAYRYKPTPQLKIVLDKSVADLIATQSPDGYIGNYAPDKHLQQWDIWGRKYCMLGLIGYYDLTQNRKALDAAGRIADHLIKELSDAKALIVKQGNHRGMAASSVLEPITLLYTRTGNKRYLDFAAEIVREWETDDGPRLLSKAVTPVGKRFPKPTGSWYGWEQGQKAYEMMSCYEGLLELYRITGNAAYKAAVENTWQSIRDTELNIAGSGSAMECWFGGKAYQTLAINHYQETCVTATWIKLSQQLLRLTGEAKYADAVEQTYYNALLGSMFADGADWAKYTPLSGERLTGAEQCHMGINCCEASGPRGLFTLPLTTVMTTADGVSINFFTPGTFTTKTVSGQLLRLDQVTDYPVSGKILITVQIPKAEKFTVRIRNPYWSQQSSVTVNGDTVSAGAAGEFIAINRNWKNGDTVNVVLDMRGKLTRSGANKEFFAITRGPLVLARDQRLGGPDTDEPLNPVLTSEGYVDLQPIDNAGKTFLFQARAVFIAESHAEGGPKSIQLLLCDYASAGNTFDPSSRFRVWIPQLVDPIKLP